MRLEDMNLLFGDATSQFPTPASGAPGSGPMGPQSPVPSLSLGQHNSENAIPGLDIDPPNVNVENGKPVISRAESERREGVGGWISNLVKRGKRGNSLGESGTYSRVGQSDD